MPKSIPRRQDAHTALDADPRLTRPAPAFVLDANDLPSIQWRLEQLGWEVGGQLMSAARIGHGNMNMTVRIQSASSRFILKQARPWVVRYPHIPAPVERAAVEACFYRTISTVGSVAQRMPRLLGFDAESHLLWIEDLGDQGDLMDIYRKRKPAAKECAELTDYLLDLHRIAVAESARGAFENRAMRALNHEHQYNFPLRSSNGLNLDAITPGLASIADRLKTDERYCARVAQLGRAYLGEGKTLLHGDFFPGSWLGTERGVAVIDPEFCFVGPAEYDLGVFLAHLALAGSTQLWASVAERYAGEADWTLARAFAGAELMRRLIGVAQLPLAADLKMKREWLEQSREMVCAI